MSYYHPTPGAISPSEIFRFSNVWNYDPKSTAYYVPHTNTARKLFQGRIWTMIDDIANNNTYEFESYHNAGTGTSGYEDFCNTPSETETIGWPDCSISDSNPMHWNYGLTHYKSHRLATEFIGIISKAECLNQNNLTYGSNRKQIAVIYKLEGADSAQCADI